MRACFTGDQHGALPLGCALVRDTGAAGLTLSRDAALVQELVAEHRDQCPLGGERRSIRTFFKVGTR